MRTRFVDAVADRAPVEALQESYDAAQRPSRPVHGAFDESVALLAQVPNRSAVRPGHVSLDGFAESSREQSRRRVR